MSYYHLTDERALDELVELLTNYSCRDQDDQDDLRKDAMSERRRRGHELAKQLRDHAKTIQQTFAAIAHTHNEFNEVTRMLPSLLEAIFDVDNGPPDNLFLPSEIYALQSFWGERDWDAVHNSVQKLVDLPIRSLNRGPVPNVVLHHSVRACREYWTSREHRSWSMSSLKNRGTSAPLKTSDLQGECEGIVADLISACTIRFTLAELASTWEAVDKDAARLRKNATSAASGER